MFFRFVRGNNAHSKRLSEMLMQLKDIDRTMGNSPEHAQLIQEIDEAIVHANDDVIRTALEKAGLTSASMVARLKESKEHILRAKQDGVSHVARNTKKIQVSSHNCYMNFYFDPNWSLDKQVEEIFDMINEINKSGSQVELYENSKYIREQFYTFQRSSSDLVKELSHEQNLAKTANQEFIVSAINDILSFLE